MLTTADELEDKALGPLDPAALGIHGKTTCQRSQSGEPEGKGLSSRKNCLCQGPEAGGSLGKLGVPGASQPLGPA